MTNRPSNIFRQWINDYIETAAPGTQLPSVATLSTRFNLSVSTIRSILNCLAKDNKCVSIPGRGTYLPSRTDISKVFLNGEKADPIQTIIMETKNLIAEGKLKVGENLPSNKYMCNRFKVAPRTVTISYQELVKNNIVSKIGRYYRVGQLHEMMHSQKSKILFFLAPSKEIIEHFLQREQYEMLFNVMESELSRNGYRIHFDTYDSIQNINKKSSFANTPLGGFFLLAENDLTVIKERYYSIRPILQKISKYTKSTYYRTILLTKNYSEQLPDTFFFSISHQKTAVLREILKLVTRNRCKCIIFFLDLNSIPLRDCINYFRMAPEIIYRNSGVDLKFLFIQSQKFQSKNDIVNGMLSIWGKEHIEIRLRKYEPYTIERLQRCFLVEDSLQKSIFSKDSKTLVVCPGSSSAIAALEWCKEKELKVPDTVSIVALQDNQTCIMNGISVCINDWNTIGYLCAHSIIGDTPIKTSNKGFIHSAALTIERKTT